MPRRKESLPKEFKKYFWDVDFKKISLKENINLVLSRILRFGNMKAVRWLLKNISPKKIKEYLLLMGDRQLDWRSNNFWRLFFGLPALRREKATLWPY